MKDITEIIFGDSLYWTMSKSKLRKNKIIKFDIIFSIANLSYIDEYKVIYPKDIYKKEIVYNFSKEIDKLDKKINKKNKIRVWCSYQDSDSYILLTYISNYIKEKNFDLYVLYSDDLNKEIQLPVAMLQEEELEELANKEHKLSKEEIIELSNLWNKIKTKESDIRIMENKEVKLVSFDYFNTPILNRLKELGEVKVCKLVGHLMTIYHFSDTILMYLVERLIKLNKITITEDNNRLWHCTIKINWYTYIKK